MSCSECIVYEYIAKRSKVFAECFTVLCLFCSVTCVFKKNNISVFHSFNSCFCVWSNYFRISCKFNFLSKELRKSYCYWCK